MGGDVRLFQVRAGHRLSLEQTLHRKRRSVVLLALIASPTHGAEGAGMEQTLTLPHLLKACPARARSAGRTTCARPTCSRHDSCWGTAGHNLAVWPGWAPAGGVYSRPVPPDAIHDGALSMRVTVTQSKVPPRGPLRWRFGVRDCFRRMLRNGLQIQPARLQMLGHILAVWSISHGG
jgi:hypothetical protein